MKRRELIGHLQREGCRLDREGGRHTIYTNPANGAKAPVPRHAEIDNRLARKHLSTACDHPDPLSALRFMGSMSFPDAGNKNMQILVYNSTDGWSGSIGIEFVEEDQRFPFGKSYDYLRQDATLNRVPLEK